MTSAVQQVSAFFASGSGDLRELLLSFLPVPSAADLQRFDAVDVALVLAEMIDGLRFERDGLADRLADWDRMAEQVRVDFDARLRRSVLPDDYYDRGQ